MEKCSIAFSRKLRRMLCLILILSILASLAVGSVMAESPHSGIERYTVLLLDVEAGFTINVDGEDIYKVETPIDTVRAAANKFISQMRNTEEINHVAVVTYAEEIDIATDFSSDFDYLENVVSSITVGEGFANINAALREANAFLSNIDDESAIKNVVIFNQGIAGAGEHEENGKYTEEDCSWVRASTNVHMYEYANAAYATAEILKEKYNVYSIGLFQSFDGVPEAGQSMLSFAQQFSEDIQNAGYIAVDDVDNLEFAFGEVADIITENLLVQVFINQHIQYVNSDRFLSDVVEGYPVALKELLAFAQDDFSINSYNLASITAKGLNLDFDFTEEDMYELILAQLMYDDQSRSHLQEAYQNNLANQVIQILKTILASEEVVSYINNTTLLNKMKQLLSELATVDCWSDVYISKYSELMSLIDDNIGIEQIAEALTDNSFSCVIGMELASSMFTMAKDLIEYIAYGSAYMDTSDEFKKTLVSLAVSAYEASTGAYSDFEEIGLLEAFFVEGPSFQNAILNFIGEMEAYKNEGAKAVADYAMETISEGLLGFAENVVTAVAVKVADEIIKCIPVLRLLPLVREGLSAGLILVELCTNVDERAYAVEMLKKLYVVAVLMYDVVKKDAALLRKEETFERAVQFDQSMGVYKSVLCMAADYGAVYAKRSLEDENDSIWPSAAKISQYSAIISQMAVQKILCEEIKCHSVGLSYNPNTGIIDYDDAKLKIFTIACPVNVTIKDDDGAVIAILSDNETMITNGYESYFFKIEQSTIADDSIKIAIVPEDYTVVLTGSGNGFMNAYVADYKQVENAKAFLEIPVSEGDAGCFVKNDENGQIEYLKMNNHLYGELTEDNNEQENLPCDGGANCPSAKFKDVNASDWFHEYIDFAVSNGLFGGMSDTTFEPNTAMTRAMLVTVLWRYAGQPNQGANSFTDVPNDQWYTQAVAWAAHNGVVTGIGNNRFDPNGKITREQMAAILFRYANASGMDTSARGSLSSFPDGSKVSAYAVEAMRWAVAEGLINGSDGKLLPQGNATRAQVAAILMRYISKAGSGEDTSGHRYEYVISNCSWTQAQAEARARGGYLVNFNTPEEYATVLSLLEDQGLQEVYFRVGGRRDEGSRQYYWVNAQGELYGNCLNSDSIWCAGHWQAGEPNYEWEGVQENVMVIFFSEEENRWVWNDIGDEMTFPREPERCGYIIEFDTSDTPVAPDTPAEPEDPAEPDAITKVALISDYSTYSGITYYQTCWQGVETWCSANGVEYTYYQPSEDSTAARVLSVNQAVSDGANVIILPGYLFGHTLLETQDAYPDVYFVAVDVSPMYMTYDFETYHEPSLNAVCMTFAEEQAGYLAGYSAVKEGYTELGFLGGMAIPFVVRYGYGFIQGADAAASEMGVNINIKYAYGNQFYGDDKITAKMEGWYAAGTEVVFACGDVIYTSVVEAANKYDAKVIGVDIDQSYIDPCIITSATKDLQAAVEFMLEEIEYGNWDDTYGGTFTLLSLSEGDFLGLPTDTWSMQNFTVEEYEAVKSEIADGTRVIDNSSDAAVLPTVSAYTNVEFIGYFQY